MSRTHRLFDLLQLLRRHRRPVPAERLAGQLGISLRTLYRDIATLRTQGATIAGAPGLGYVLQPDFMLPPLMFGLDEIDALVLGTRWVADRGDERLADAARHALAKIAAVLPPELRHAVDSSPLLAGPAATRTPDSRISSVRDAIRTGRKLVFDYRDNSGQVSTRTVWPHALGFFEGACLIVAWCELRQAIRHFRVDRMSALQAHDGRAPRRRQDVLREWRAQQGIADERD